MRIIAVVNQKGGVGKTTSVINIASYWARAVGGDRVLVIDVDPQANATSIFLGTEIAAGPRRPDIQTIKEVLDNKVEINEAIYLVELEASGAYPASNLHIVPAHPELGLIESPLNQAPDGLFRLIEAVETLEDNYDVIIIDCPPSLGTFTTTALITAKEVIVPVIPGRFEMVGLALLTQTIKRLNRPRLNPDLHIGGILPTKTNRTRIAKDTIEELKSHFGDLVLPEIPERVAIHEAHASGKDIFCYAPDNDGAEAYAKAVKKLMRRQA